MYRHLYFYFVAQQLYDIDFVLAHKFINEDLVKYADCDFKWDSELGKSYTCDISPKYHHIIPKNLTQGITFTFL